jgi:ring-1,2-phenylacetyl-CoA epoxidase subunit PaaD
MVKNLSLKTLTISSEEILQILKQVKDPEVPVIDIVELGVVRNVLVEENNVQINITPTYSGCPAMQVIEQEIKDTLKKNGIENFSIKTIFSPAWTTDWLTDEAKQKLKDYGIAPPSGTTEQHLNSFIKGKFNPVQCPFCNSVNTRITSAFGSTACKALHFCNNCMQPFEEFKCH